ncbi:MAG: TerB family tellurite resistance protein [Thermodesulfobacteriota bacterium]|nr:TerB family tellurite resistance protein [Thermodesulfobacteriota bacterium]
MHKTITWQEVQYGREKLLYKKIRPVLEDLRNRYKVFSEKTQYQEREFFRHLSHSLKLDKLPSIASLLNIVKERLNLDAQINVFLFQSPIPNAMCMPRYGILYKDKSQKLVILVSQHFMNDLNSVERLSILGHELGHLLFGHVDIPARIILESEFGLAHAKDIKSNILKWMICTELSCDVIGMLCCNLNIDAFCNAMLKYTTGLAQKIIQNNTENVLIFDLLLDQYNEISESLFDAIMTTHPLTPLRLKIMKTITQTELIKRIGDTLEYNELEILKEKYNNVIDSLIYKIYPEVVLEGSTSDNTLQFSICLAVALSDGRISKDEVAAIHAITNTRGNIGETYKKIEQKLKYDSAAAIVDSILKDTVKKTKVSGMSRTEVVKMVRHALLVAASDGKIEKNELDTIYNFAVNFGISKEDIVTLIGQMNIN